MTDLEREVILEIGGVTQWGLSWGAATAAVLDFLEEDGLVFRGKLTVRGREVFDAIKPTP